MIGTRHYGIRQVCFANLRLDRIVEGGEGPRSGKFSAKMAPSIHNECGLVRIKGNAHADRTANRLQFTGLRSVQRLFAFQGQFHNYLNVVGLRKHIDRPAFGHPVS